MTPLIGITCGVHEQAFMLKKAYVSAIIQAGGAPIMLPAIGGMTTKAIERISQDLDGLVLSGGGDLLPEYYGEAVSVPYALLKFIDKERSDFEIKLLKETIRQCMPVLGICYGMQLINVFFGGTLYQDIGTQCEATMNHRDGQHDINISSELVNRHIAEFLKSGSVSRTVSVNTSHHQAVRTIGKGLDIFAVSGDGIIEGFYGRDYPFLVGIQWHPERSLSDSLSSIIFRTFIEAAQLKSAGKPREAAHA